MNTEHTPLLSEGNSIPTYNQDPESGVPRKRSTAQTPAPSSISNVNPSEEDNERQSCTTLLGFSFAIIAALCYTSSNVMVKFAPELSSWQLLLVRCISQILTMIPVMIWTKSPVIPPDFSTRWKVAAQGILGGFLILLIFVAINSLPIGDATAIFFTSPAFTMILSTLILRDHCGVYRSVLAATLIIGVVVLSRPESIFSRHVHTEIRDSDLHAGEYNMAGILAALSVPILSSWIVILTRQAKHIHYSVLVFWFGIGGLVVAMVGNILNAKPQVSFPDWNSRQWVLASGVGVVGIIGSIVMNKAVQWVTPAKVMVVRSFEVVFAYILQLTVFGCPFHWSDLGGTILLMIAVLGMALEDIVMRTVKWTYI